jgi:hypothetical protein
MHFTKRFFVCSIVTAVFAAAPGAHALPPVADVIDAGYPNGTPAAEQAAPPEASGAFVPGFGVAARPQQLDNARGGSGAVATATVGGSVTGNSATNVVTGANTIQASSFAGAVGIPIVIQNSGANVLIQNATVINLQLQ